MGKPLDLTGQRFGYLTVIKEGPPHIYPSGKARRTWECKCDCGNTITVKTNLLRNGHTKSCGCLHSELVSKFNTETKKKYNTYDLTGDYGIGYDCKNRKFYFDLEDYDKIKDYCWIVRNSSTKGLQYVEANITISKYNYSSVKMHRIVMNCNNPDLEIDHINHDGTDNRKFNLRTTNNSGNNTNKDIRNNNNSGITGVCWDKEKGKWVTYIKKDNISVHLGYYNDFSEAAKVRLVAETEYFKEYAYKDNFRLLNYLEDGGKLIPYDKEMINSIKLNYKKKEE